MRVALLLPFALALAACGSGSTAKPPPAWLETKAGNRWLGYSSYCWNHPEGNAVAHVCADAAAPKCSQRSVPNLSVSSGETVRAHLGFTPDEASVDNGKAGLSGRVVAWKIERAGPFLLFTKATDADASYVGCAVLP